MYIVPVTYVYHKGYVYVHSKEGQKVKAMRKNPKVCFQVDSIENMRSWRSVILWGEYEELKSEKAQRSAMKIMTDRLSPLALSETVVPIQNMTDAPKVIEKSLKAVAYRIKITRKSGCFEKNA